MDACQEDDILVMTTTVAAPADAERLARRIVDARLAACVQVDAGLRSVYRWQGQVCEDSELRLTIKTTPAQEAALRALLREAHPYELPQVVVFRAAASPEYAHWVRESLRS